MSGSRVSYLAKPVQEARGRGSRQQSQELGPRWGLPPRPHWPGPLGLGQARGAPVPQALCVGGTSSTLFLLSRGGRRRPGRSGLCCCHSRGGCRTCPFPRRDMQCTGLCWGRAEGATPGSVWALGFLRGPAWPSGRWRGPCLWSRDSGRLVARAASSLTKAGDLGFLSRIGEETAQGAHAPVSPSGTAVSEAGGLGGVEPACADPLPFCLLPASLHTIVGNSGEFPACPGHRGNRKKERPWKIAPAGQGR